MLQGPQFTLLLAVDGATSAVVNAVFRPEEDTSGYFVLMQGLIQRGGVPLARYGDRHGVSKFSGKPKHIPPPLTYGSYSWGLNPADDLEHECLVSYEDSGGLRAKLLLPVKSPSGATADYPPAIGVYFQDLGDAIST